MDDTSFMLRQMPDYSGIGLSFGKARTFIQNLDFYISVTNSTRTDKLSDLEKVSLLISLLKGNAANWVASQVQNRDFMNKPWEEARELFLQKFSSSSDLGAYESSSESDFNSQAVATEYNHLKQYGNVEAYSKRFETLRSALPSSYESQAATKDRYLAGLKEDLAYMVAVRMPVDKIQAKQYAKEIETYQLLMKGKTLGT